MRVLLSAAALLTLSFSVGGCNPPKPAGEAVKEAEGNQAPAAVKAPGAKAGDVVSKPAKEETGPVARVNGVEISRESFNAKFQKMTKTFTARKKQIPEGLAQRYKRSILKQLIDKELLQQKIKSEQIAVTPEEMEKEFADYKKMFRTEKNFQRYLKSSGVSMEQIKENIRHNLSVTKLLQKISDLNLPKEEIQKYYQENSKRYQIKEQVRASHILLKVKKGEEDVNIKKKADELYKKATADGADFAALA